MYTTFLGKKESINVYVKGEENKNKKACGIQRKNHFNTFEQKKKGDLELLIKIENYYEINEVINGKLETYEAYYQI